MRLTFTQEARQQQTQRIDPRQILASDILTWSSMELDAAVERELAENPALELRDIGGGGEPSCVFDPHFAFAPQADTRTGEIGAKLVEGAAFAEPQTGLTNPTHSGTAALSLEWDDADPLEHLVCGITLRDHLRAQIGQVTSDPSLRPVVAYLIDCLDERGYLSFAADEVAERFLIPCSEVERAVHALQSMEPAGIGGRDLRDCLRLQVEHLQQTGEAHPLAHRILTNCWVELAGRREDRICARLRVTAGDVRAAIRFLRTALTPNPADAFRPEWSSRIAARGGFGGQPAATLPGGNAGSYAPPRPDLVFRHTESGFLAEPARDIGSSLYVSAVWLSYASGSVSNPDEATARYLREHVERAQAFLVGVNRRGAVLRRIALALVDCQPGYLVTGDRAFLRPLTRQRLAEILETDESVISRAVNNKWAQLPTGDIVPLDSFFGSSDAVRDALVDVVAREDPRRPYSDDEIAGLLTERGFPLARRTVAKYRGMERILPARLRRQALVEKNV